MRIAILYTSIGLGHKVIAENLGNLLNSFGANTALMDVTKISDGKTASGGTWLHSFINRKLPWFWMFLYDFGYIPFLPFRLLVARLNNREIKKELVKFDPQIVICTQTTATALALSVRSGGEHFKIFAAFSDYHFHPFWFYKGVDGYLVNILEQRKILIDRGVSGSDIFQIGFGAGELLRDKFPVREKFKIPTDKKIVLITSGSLGYLIPESIFKLLLEDEKIVVILVTGKNVELLKKYEKWNERLIVLPWFEHMQALYLESDVVLGKPGGLTCFELLRLRIPLFVTHVLPGQEDRNMEYLVTRGLVVDVRGLLVRDPLAFKRLIMKEAFEGAVRGSEEFKAAVSKEVIFGDNKEMVLKFFESLSKRI